MRPIHVTFLFVLLAALLPAQAINIGGGPIFDGQGGPITAVVHATGDWQVPAGETLTIGAGSSLKFSGRVTGRITVSGTLVLQGTASSPIFVTSLHDDEAGGNTNNSGTIPAPGQWNGIHLRPGGRVVMDHTTVRFGFINLRMTGGAGPPPILEARDCTISHAERFGIDGARTGDYDLNRVDISDCLDHPIDDIPLEQVANLRNMTASNNATGPILHANSQGVSSNVTLSPENTFNGSGSVCFLFGADLTIDVGGELTLEAGMVFKFANGGMVVEGTLNCNGSAADPVVFTTLLDDSFGGDTNGDGAATFPGSLPGMRLRGFSMRSGSSASVLRHAIVREHTGFGGAGIALSSCSPVLEDVTVERVFGSTADGLRLSGSCFPTVRRMVIREVPDIAISGVSVEAIGGFVDNTASQCGNGDYMTLNAGATSNFGVVQITPRNYPGDVLVIARSFDLEAGDRLTLTDGVIVKFDGGPSQTCEEGAFDLLGTASRPVILTSITDDSVGGDTEKDGPVGAATWGRIRWTRNAAASRVEHALIRNYSQPLACDSALMTLRAVRFEPTSNAIAAIISNLAAPADNLVVFVRNPGTRDGLRLNGGSFDLRHATVFGTGGNGIAGFSNWTGSIINSISFGNLGSNIVGVPDTRVRNSIGEFPGINGNLVVDPLFVDAPNGDLRLSLGSAALDSADGLVAQATIIDHLENPRALASSLTSPFAPDRGAFERAVVNLDLAGVPQLGGGVTLDVTGPGITSVFYLIGTSLTPVFAPPAGTGLIGLPNELLVLGPFGPPATSVTFGIFPDPALIGLEFGAQALVEVSTPAGPRPLLSNRQRIRIF